MSEGGATLGYDGNKLSSEKRKSLNWHVYEMGEPLFAFAAPTGYPEDSSKWVNSGALIDRLNFALALMQQEVTDMQVELPKLLADVDADQPAAVLDQCPKLSCTASFPRRRERRWKRTSCRVKARAKQWTSEESTALILGSPEFQRRYGSCDAGSRCSGAVEPLVHAFVR